MLAAAVEQVDVPAANPGEGRWARVPRPRAGRRTVRPSRSRRSTSTLGGRRRGPVRAPRGTTPTCVRGCRSDRCPRCGSEPCDAWWQTAATRLVESSHAPPESFGRRRHPHRAARQHRVGLPPRGRDRRRCRGGAAHASPPGRDPSRPHDRRAYDAGAGRAGRGRRAPRHRAAQRQPARPARGHRGGRHPPRVGHVRHEGWRRGDAQARRRRHRPQPRPHLHLLRGRGGRLRAQRPAQADGQRPRPGRGRLRS